ncbi:PfkB family carbohydrate kinase [Streptomyces flavofungini]|uniref:Carbohydrate kinase PfkB domain-containing protein n=1 Tax=Streptomyces flavofungini TaxID=68200 RepID=A0ABS0X7E3_9ACTN|nr:PfkB family carbohydrate kinase [Streptomyces flavofungini]MBJ3809127.1 hypothetical protein [Streptomyces flavofungini]GHC68683.1 hypothetical protein GCM10010349_43010 [Streptomyces flavofungini]
MRNELDGLGEIVVMGSLVMDRKYFSAGTHTSAAGGRTQAVWSVERHHGGVGRNVAVNLARLGARPAFVGLSGFGPDAGKLEDELTRLGVRLQVLRTAHGIGRFDVTLDGLRRQLASRIALPDPAAAVALRGPAGRIASCAGPVHPARRVGRVGRVGRVSRPHGPCARRRPSRAGTWPRSSVSRRPARR